MCKHAFEEYSERTKKVMLFCDLKKSEDTELKKICSCQHYCTKEGKYTINSNVRQYCINFE